MHAGGTILDYSAGHELYLQIFVVLLSPYRKIMKYTSITLQLLPLNSCSILLSQIILPSTPYKDRQKYFRIFFSFLTFEVMLILYWSVMYCNRFKILCWQGTCVCVCVVITKDWDLILTIHKLMSKFNLFLCSERAWRWLNSGQNMVPCLFTWWK